MDARELEAVSERIKQANAEIKTVPIKGKEYAGVNERVAAFRKVFPLGRIETTCEQDADGRAVFTAAIYDNDGHKLATGTAFEVQNSSYINKTSYIENCVPLSAQILTADGWKYYFQVKPGDKVFSLNMETGKTELCDLLAVNYYEKKPLLELSSARFKVLCTPQHKWIARTQYKPLHKVETQNLTSAYKIVQALRQDVEPSVIGRKLGWLMCDCDPAYTSDGMISTAYISQTKHVFDVAELFGEGRPTKTYNDSWKTNYEWVIPAKEVREILGHFGIANYTDLWRAMLSAPLEDVAGCFRSMMLADGSKNTFSSTYPELIEAVQIMCVRLGIATNHVASRMCQKSTKPIYTLGMKDSDGAWFSEMKVRNIPPKDVWCPTTANGTWFMKQGDIITLTSNCESSAVGRALGFAGFGIVASIASADEVVSAVEQQTAAEKIDANEAEVLRNLIKSEAHEKNLLERFGVASFEELTREQYAQAVTQYKQWLAKRAKK